jgi:hypothetical protein
MTDDATTEIGWAILELMGHRKLAGFVTDDNGLVRIDVYTEDPESLPGSTTMAPITPPPIATQWYGRAAIYCITASTKEMCLRVAAANQPAPVGRWELPERVASPGPEPDDADVEPERDDDTAYTDQEMAGY